MFIFYKFVWGDLDSWRPEMKRIKKGPDPQHCHKLKETKKKSTNYAFKKLKPNI